MTKILNTAADIQKKLVSLTKASDTRARRQVTMPAALIEDDFFSGC